jgi:hypothetical protein
MWTNLCCRTGGYEGGKQSGTTVVFVAYTVHVGISVAKAGWDSPGDDVVPTSIKVQDQPLAAVPRHCVE